LNNQEGVVPLSFAVGLATLKKGESLSEMVTRADEAMYEDKLNNRQAFRTRVYDTFRKALIRMQFKSAERMSAFAGLSRQFGEYLNLDNFMVDQLEQLSLFGVIGVLEQGNLSVDLYSEESREARERCAVVGYRVALTLPQLAPMADEILARFERWDGKGVPRGIAGNDIPLLSRVVRVVAAYFFTPTSQDAVEVLKDRAGTLLDPSLSERFLSFLEDQDEIPRFDEYEETSPQA
jgi:response regulator RpfG family c-di-GMP phosphodiesterase